MSTNGQKQQAVLAAGNRALGIIPSTFEDCYRMAKLFSQTALVPKDYQGNPEAACVAIMQGLEVGLSPMAALQSIAVINGRPSIWGDGALALVRASGLLEYMHEEDDGETATCTVQRKGEPKPIVRKFSQQDAAKAGLLRVKEGKQPGPWHTYPQRMRPMRARSWAIRDGFADVLKGLHIGEESQDVPMRDITPKAMLELPDIPDEPAPVVATPEAADEQIADPSLFLAKLGEELNLAGDETSTREVWEANLEIVEGRLSRTDRTKAEALYETALASVAASQEAAE